MIKLTQTQRTYLQAAIECDSINNQHRLRLQVLNRLDAMGLLEQFDMDASWGRKIIYHFAITSAGKAALEGAQVALIL